MPTVLTSTTSLHHHVTTTHNITLTCYALFNTNIILTGLNSKTGYVFFLDMYFFYYNNEFIYSAKPMNKLIQ